MTLRFPSFLPWIRYYAREILLFDVLRNLNPDTTGTYETFQEKIRWTRRLYGFEKIQLLRV